MKGQGKTSSNTSFQSLVEEGGHCRANWARQVVEIATPFEFDENYRFFSSSCYHYMGHSFRLFFYTFHHKKDTEDGF
jgi:hypothetical protein